MLKQLSYVLFPQPKETVFVYYASLQFISEGRDIDVQALMLFINRSGYRREVMSRYMDRIAVNFEDIELAGCDHCGSSQRSRSRSSRVQAMKGSRCRRGSKSSDAKHRLCSVRQ